MVDRDVVFVLGAQDPEMREIERALRRTARPFVHAARRGQRSTLGEAVFADPTAVPQDLAEGAAYVGKPVRYRQLLPGGELKEMLKGANAEHIERFMAAHDAAGRQVYGNPYRGYC